jgi:hypothetical protein
LARTYSARLVALTLGVPTKWVDNLLSHHEVPGVSRVRQGVERRITDVGFLAIEATRLLATELGVPLASAVAIARAAVVARSKTGMRFVTMSDVVVSFPVEAIEQGLRERVVAAVESLGRRPRGRPRTADLHRNEPT